MSGLEGRSLVWEVGRRRIVDDVDVDVGPGELLALAGPNGAGKSTLLRLLAGDLAPSSGEVRFDGVPLASMRPAEQARRRAVMPQHTTLQFAFTVREVASMGRYPHPPSPDDAAIVDSALCRSDIAHLAERTFMTLSGGEQSLATLARVLAQETGVLLLDEPTAALDIRHKAHVMTIAREAADDGAAVCVVVHDLNLAAAYADRVVLLHEGRKLGDGTPWETLTSATVGRAFSHRVAVTRSPLGNYPLITPHHTTGAQPAPPGSPM